MINYNKVIDYLKRLLADDNGEPNLKLHIAFILFWFIMVVTVLGMFDIFSLSDNKYESLFWFLTACLGIGVAERFRKNK